MGKLTCHNFQVFLSGFWFWGFLAEGANNVAGLGYNGQGKNHHARWDGVFNVKVLNVGCCNAVAVLIMGYSDIITE